MRRIISRELGKEMKDFLRVYLWLRLQIITTFLYEEVF